MFGLPALFAALKRLTASVNTSADLFDAANEQLRKQLAIDGPADAPAIGHKDNDDGVDAPAKPGRKNKAA